MREIYSLIEEYKENNDCTIVTGINGDIAGEHGLIVNGNIVYENNIGKSLDSYLADILGISSCGIVDTDAGQLFVERLGMNARIIVCGAGTVGQEVIKLGKMLGLNVVVLEDRSDYADIAKNLGADEVYCMAFVEGLSNITPRDTDYYVVVTREHKYDKLCLQNIISRKKAYVGLMSSRNRAQIMRDTLRFEGARDEEVNAICSPIGLNIKAQTPPEIAVSIFAEIISHKNSIVKTEGYKKEILEGILNSENNSDRMILATIVSRTGSAPRDVGTKMLIHEDGSIVGSVGGGWIEANTLKLARSMFEADEKYSLYETDRQSEEAVLCGGYESIYLEMI